MIRLIKSNIKRNLSTYLFYYLALVVNISVVYIFISIPTNKDLLKIINAFEEIAKTFQTSAVIVGLFSIVFMNYCANYFIKNRSKEIGLYSLFGLKKTKIALMLVGENLIIGLFAIITGIGIGVFFSKLIMMILVNYLGLSTVVGLTFNLKSILWTFLIYVILFLFNCIYIFHQVYKSSLLQLFQKNTIGEFSKSSSVIVGFLGVLMIISGYFIGLLGVRIIDWFIYAIPITLILCIIGTFLFYRNFINSGLKRFTKNKKLVYQKGRIIWLRRISHRIRTCYKIITLITLLIAVALTAIGITKGLNIQLVAYNELENPYQINYITDDLEKDLSVQRLVDAQKDEVMMNKAYQVKQVKDDGYIISDSNFQSITVDESSAIAYFHENESMQRPEQGLRINKRQLNIVRSMNQPLFNRYPLGKTYIVDDEIYNQYIGEEFLTRGIKFNNPFEKIETIATINDQLDLKPYEEISIILDQLTTLLVFKIVVFISIIMGIIFIFSSASILYIKIINSTLEDRESFLTLKQVGFKESHIKEMMKKFTKSFYYWPLMIGSMHAIVALMMLKFLLLNPHISGMNYRNIFWPSLKVFIIFYSVYFLFYKFTLKKSFDKVL